MSDVDAGLAELDRVVRELDSRGDTELAGRARAAVASVRAATAPADLVTTGEAAALLGVRSINTVKRWARDGMLDGFQVGGRVKVTRASVEQLLASATVGQQRAYERDLAEVLDAFDAGDDALPPSELPHIGRAPWSPIAQRRS